MDRDGRRQDLRSQGLAVARLLDGPPGQRAGDLGPGRVARADLARARAVGDDSSRGIDNQDTAPLAFRGADDQALERAQLAPLDQLGRTGRDQVRLVLGLGLDLGVDAVAEADGERDAERDQSQQ
jgi:hypothetical protein